MFFRLPDLFDIKTSCGGGNPECPFPPIPSFTTNKNGKIRPTGAFAPNAQYFVLDLAGTGQRFSFLFQDGKVVVDTEGDPTSWTFTAETAHLYVGHQFVCEGDTDSEGATEEENLDRCVDFPLEVDITVTR